MKKIGVIIPAGGVGTRMAFSGTVKRSTEAPDIVVPKQFMTLGGRPVLAHVITAFRSVAAGADIVVALPEDRMDEWARLCTEHDVPSHKICEGGATRFHSVQNALADLDPDCEYIAVHDAARPLVSGELILRTIETAHRHGTAIPVVPLADSVRRIRPEAEDDGKKSEGRKRVAERHGTDNGWLESTSYPEERSTLRAVQTPQVFRADILQTGYERAAGEDFTDDATVVESVGFTVMLCEGERRNIKITEPADMTIAEGLLRR